MLVNFFASKAFHKITFSLARSCYDACGIIFLMGKSNKYTAKNP